MIPLPLLSPAQMEAYRLATEAPRYLPREKAPAPKAPVAEYPIAPVAVGTRAERVLAVFRAYAAIGDTVPYAQDIAFLANIDPGQLGDVLTSLRRAEALTIVFSARVGGRPREYVGKLDGKLLFSPQANRSMRP